MTFEALARASVRVARIMVRLDPDERAELVRRLQAAYGRPLTPGERKERFRSKNGTAAFHQGNETVPQNGNGRVPPGERNRSARSCISPVVSPVVSEVVRSEVQETTEETTRKELQEPQGFVRFWRAYPKRIGKGKARQSWIKNRCESRTDVILNAIENQREFLLRDGGQFIPNPATWLNEKRWEDEPPAMPSPGDARTARNVAGVSEWLRQQEAP